MTGNVYFNFVKEAWRLPDKKYNRSFGDEPKQKRGDEIYVLDNNKYCWIVTKLFYA